MTVGLVRGDPDQTSYADDRLVEGFHDYEQGGGLGWTDGDALLPAALFDGLSGPAELVLHLDGATRYPADSRAPA